MADQRETRTARRIVTFNHVSADGYFAAADGSLNWVVQDEEIHEHAGKGMSEVDTILFGRRTYEMFAAFWPRALDESGTAPDPHHPGHRSVALREMAVWLNKTPKVVFSATLKDAAWNNSRIVRAVDPREIAAMKRQPGKDMIVFGSGSIVSQFTVHGLIDEYQFVVSPVLLGSGRALLTGVPGTVRLHLQEASPHPSGVVRLQYVRK